MIDVSFQLKGSAISVVVLALVRYDPAILAQELQEKIDQAPQFFFNSPVLINLEKLEQSEESLAALQDMAPLLAICRKLGLQPLGFTAVPEALLPAVQATQLALLPRPGERVLKMPEPEPQPQPQRDDSAEPQILVETVVEERLVQRVSKLITRPIRSGQQIYAEGADLIVMSQVSEGAEVLADGHIHIYGALRGRALAGVRGDDSARIFCQNLEAELVSVAGNFLLRDSFADDVLKKPVQIYMSGENLLVEKLQS
jgi:septum site-determining protein MinC